MLFSFLTILRNNLSIIIKHFSFWDPSFKFNVITKANTLGMMF